MRVLDSMCRVRRRALQSGALVHEDAVAAMRASLTSPLGSTTTLLADVIEAEDTIAYMPLAMEPPAQRPVRQATWRKSIRDSRRPDVESVAPQALPSKGSWARKAAGRPPQQIWRKVWLFLKVRTGSMYTLLRGTCMPAADSVTRWGLSA